MGAVAVSARRWPILVTVDDTNGPTGVGQVVELSEAVVCEPFKERRAPDADNATPCKLRGNLPECALDPADTGTMSGRKGF